MPNESMDGANLMIPFVTECWIAMNAEKVSKIPVVKIAAMLLVFMAMTVAPAEAIESAQGRVRSIAFRFQPITIGEKRAFHVEVRFRTAEQVTAIRVPARWGGAQHLEGQTQNLKVLTHGVTLEDSADPGEKMLHARPGERVKLAYDIVPLQTGLFQHPQEHMAIINADYFLFNPRNALVYPKLPSTDLVDATFDWRALPKGMPFVSSFGDGKRELRVLAPWFQIQDALFAGGDFRLTKSFENGTTLVLATRGTWKFTDAEAFEKIRRVIDEENKFWRANPMPFFLVTLAPFDDKSGTNDGSGFTNAFMLFLAHEDTFDAVRVKLLAHEMFHHWNSMSMGPADEVMQWFTEGFTVYYEMVIPLRAGLITYADYLKYLNRRLQEYQTSPLRKVSNAEWWKLSHTSGPGYGLPYTRGAAVALWADAAIRARSGGKLSLDNVMFDLVHEAQGPKPPELTEDRVFSAFARYLSPDQEAQMRAMAVDGAEVPLPKELGDCAQLEPRSQTVVDIGFDEKSLESKRIAGVDPAGPAYRAGIRDGQEVFRVSIYHDDPSKDILLGVVVDGKREMIHYSGAKQQEITQYRANAEGSGARACTPF
jgi:predicted metalloprotease with PDZ domain